VRTWKLPYFAVRYGCKSSLVGCLQLEVKIEIENSCVYNEYVLKWGNIKIWTVKISHPLVYCHSVVLKHVCVTTVDFEVIILYNVLHNTTKYKADRQTDAKLRPFG
jgi:hypothetical protein